MNNFDLTENKVFSKKNTEDSFEQMFLSNSKLPKILARFDDSKCESKRTGALYVGKANDIVRAYEYEGFGINDGTCDRCGGIVPAWMPSGLCEDCEKEVSGECTKPDWVLEEERRTSTKYIGENEWFFL